MESNFSEILSQKFPITIFAKINTGQLNSEITGFLQDGEIKIWKINISALPEKGKANIEIKKFFKKQYTLKATIKNGETNKRKKIYLEKL